MEKEITKSVIIDGVEYVPKKKKIESKNEYIFIIDASSSIPMEKHIQTLEQILYGLQSNNKFNILTFPDCGINREFITAFGKSKLLSKENIAKAMNLMRIAYTYTERLKGGSKLLPAIKRATKLPVCEGYKRICIIITDGYIDDLV